MDTSNDGADTANATPACPTGTLIAILPTGMVLAPARCKKWSCDPCGTKNARTLSERMMRTPARRFVTLTTRPQPGLSPTEALDQMNASWRSLWKQWKREYGPRARGYVKVIELTKHGWPHLHILIDTPYIPQSAISAAWSRLTGSQVVDIRRVGSARGMARYLAKYLTKTRIGIEHRRRWSQSASFLPPPEARVLEPGEIPLEWRYQHAQVAEMVASLEEQGYTPVGRFWARTWPLSARPFGGPA